MTKPMTCPHCNREITEEGWENQALFRQFRKTEACRLVEKKGDRLFFGGVIVIVIALFYGMLLPSSLKALTTMLFGAVVGFSIMTIGWRYESVRNKLFQEFKKLRE